MGHCLGDNGTHPVVPDRSVTIFQVRYVSTYSQSTRPASRRPVKRVKTTQTRLTPRLTVPRVNPRVELKTVYEGIGAFNPTSNPAALTSYGVVDAGDAFNQRNGKLIRHIDQSWIGRFDLGPAYDSVTFRVIHGVWNDANDPVATADILALTAPSTPDS